MSVRGYSILRRPTISTPRGERHRHRRLQLEALEDRALLTSTITEFPLSSGASAAGLLGPVTRSIQADSADLSLAVAVSSPSLFSGDALTYTLTITNAGPSDATHVVATLKLPSIVAYSGPNSLDGFAYDGATNTVTYTLDSLAAGTSADATVQGHATSTGTEPSPDLPLPAASVTSDVADPDPQNNSAPLPPLTVAQAAADLSIAGQVSGATVRVGQALSYSIQVTNHGPSPASDLKVTEQLPAGVVYDGPTGGTSGFAYDPGTGVVTYTAGAPLAPETPLALTIPVHATAAGVIPAATAAVTSAVGDPNAQDNLVGFPSVLAIAATPAHLRLSVTASSSTVVTGGTVTYTITVTNAGGDPAAGVQVADKLPAGFTFVSGDPHFRSRVVGSSVVSDLGTLDAGATLKVRIRLLAKVGVSHHTSGGMIQNRATATSSTASAASAAIATIVAANLMPPNPVGKDALAAIRAAAPKSLGSSFLKLTLGSTSLASLSAEGARKTLSGVVKIDYKVPLIGRLPGTVKFSAPYSNPTSKNVKVEVHIGEEVGEFLSAADKAKVAGAVRTAVLALVKKDRLLIAKAVS